MAKRQIKVLERNNRQIDILACEKPGFMLWHRDLEDFLDDVSDEELGWIVRHGYEYSVTGEVADNVPKDLKTPYRLLRRSIDWSSEEYVYKRLDGEWKAACRYSDDKLTFDQWLDIKYPADVPKYNDSDMQLHADAWQSMQIQEQKKIQEQKQVQVQGVALNESKNADNLSMYTPKDGLDYSDPHTQQVRAQALRDLQQRGLK